MKTKNLTDNDTGERLFALVSLREKEPDPFVKIFTDPLSAMCKSPEFGALPIALLAWIAAHTDYTGELTQSQANYSRYRGCSKVTAWKQFRLLVAAEVLFPLNRDGVVQRYLVNPALISKAAVKGRQTAAKRFESTLVQESLLGASKTSPRGNKPQMKKG